MPKSPKQQNGSANLGFEAKLWAAADALRNNMDAAEYKHVVLGLIFQQYISYAVFRFNKKRQCVLTCLQRGSRAKKPC